MCEILALKWTVSSQVPGGRQRGENRTISKASPGLGSVGAASKQHNLQTSMQLLRLPWKETSCSCRNISGFGSPEKALLGSVAGAWTGSLDRLHDRHQWYTRTLLNIIDFFEPCLRSLAKVARLSIMSAGNNESVKLTVCRGLQIELKPSLYCRSRRQEWITSTKQ